MDAGALGAKAFLVDSGVPEFPPVAEADLERGMRALAERGAPLLVHAEWRPALAPGEIDGRPDSHAAWLASRPAVAEVEAIRLLIRLSRATGAAVHVVYLSAADALEDLARARDEGLPITVETCPHYLSFEADIIEPGDTRFKCAPPIRDAENRERLWRASPRGRSTWWPATTRPARRRCGAATSPRRGAGSPRWG